MYLILLVLSLKKTLVQLLTAILHYAEVFWKPRFKPWQALAQD